MHYHSVALIRELSLREQSYRIQVLRMFMKPRQVTSAVQSLALWRRNLRRSPWPQCGNRHSATGKQTFHIRFFQETPDPPEAGRSTVTVDWRRLHRYHPELPTPASIAPRAPTLARHASAALFDVSSTPM